MTDQSLQQLPDATTVKYANVSPSPNTLVSLFLNDVTPNIRPPLCRNGRQQEKGLHQVASYEEKTRGGQLHKGTGPANSSTKRKSSEKTDHLPKKLKVVPESVMGLKAETKKTVTLISPGKGKGLMSGPGSVEKPPILLREDSK